MLMLYAALGACSPRGWANGTFYANCGAIDKDRPPRAASAAECCGACAENGQCHAWAFADEVCKLCRRLPAAGDARPQPGATSGPGMPPPPPPPPAPRPRPGAPNVMMLLTDDQDLVLGSMRAMPHTQAVLGTNLTWFYTATPICCPSRATLLSGRYNHNNKARTFADSGGGVSRDGMCMRMNTSQRLNPRFWEESFPYRLRFEHGYTVGLFGKVLNVMEDYGCDGRSTAAGVDRLFVMCKHVYYNESWIDQGGERPPGPRPVNSTGDAPEEYTTSLIGNATLRWLRSVVAAPAPRRPFFAWVGPHAPHLPSTPAPWYLDAPVGEAPLVRQPNFGVLGRDKHAFYPREPPETASSVAGIDDENARRLRSLLSVDDIVREVRQLLVAAGEWNNTFLFFSSDHGYSLGGFRVNSHKMQVYDHNSRVPLLVHNPWAPGPAAIAIPASMVDLGPTILELAAGAAAPPSMDGISFAPQLRVPGAAAPPWPRSAVLIEYQSLQGGPGASLDCGAGATAECRSAFGSGGGSICDGPNNSYSALRFPPGAGPLAGLLYAEFADVSDPLAWRFAPDRINFFELYNETGDPFMLRNVHPAAPAALKAELHARLQAAIKCRGAAECTRAL